MSSEVFAGQAKRDLAQAELRIQSRSPSHPWQPESEGRGHHQSRIGINEDGAAHQTSPALGSTSRNSLFSHTEEPRFLQQLSTKACSTPQSSESLPSRHLVLQ